MLVTGVGNFCSADGFDSSERLWAPPAAPGPSEKGGVLGLFMPHFCVL